MAANLIADSGFLVALLTDRATEHDWAVSEAIRFPRPWKTCEAAISEAFYLLRPAGTNALTDLLDRGAVVSAFDFAAHTDEVLRLMKKYNDVPIAFADACLVRMTEVYSDPILLTTDSDFRIYRRHGRQIVPCVMPR
jgi:predicted nucleic acid-binding protein